MRRYLIAGAVLPLVLACAPAFAQDAAEVMPASPPPADAPAEPPAPACCTAPKDTVIQLEVVPLISTKAIKRGDKFEIRLAEPLVVDGRVLLPAGVAGGGEVIHAAGPGIGGKPGELMLAARYLDFDGRRIPLKGMKLGRAGQDNGAASLAVSMVTPIGMFIPGGHVEVPAGTRANAKLATELVLPPIAGAAPASAVQTAADTQTTPTQEQ